MINDIGVKDFFVVTTSFFGVSILILFLCVNPYLITIPEQLDSATSMVTIYIQDGALKENTCNMFLEDFFIFNNELESFFSNNKQEST